MGRRGRRVADSVPVVELTAPGREKSGFWTAYAHSAHASELVRAVDPDLEFVVIERHSSASSEWSNLPLPLSRFPAAHLARTVRTVRFDALLTPAELIAAAPDFDAADQGWLFLWQTATFPPPYLSLQDKTDRAREDAMRGVGVTLLIDLPHLGETAKLSSPGEQALTAALERLSA
jgi:hypothetical protein